MLGKDDAVKSDFVGKVTHSERRIIKCSGRGSELGCAHIEAHSATWNIHISFLCLL